MSEDFLIWEVPPDKREDLATILDESFEGWYLWHSKRTLRSISLVKAASIGKAAAGLIMLKELGEKVGYIYYVAVRPEFRRKEVAGRLVDDALGYFASRGDSMVYATVEEDNLASFSLFNSRGFAATSFGDISRAHGRLKARYMMFEMRVVAGEVMLLKTLQATKNA